MKPVSRREMLAALAGGVAALATPVPSRLDGFVQRAAERSGESELDSWLISRLAESDVKATAAAWRAMHPAESSRERLTHAILAGHRNREPLTDYLARVVAAEHRDGRGESVDGWMLAPTEARLATLLDLIRNR